MRRLTAADVEWADVVFVMEPEHRERLLAAHRGLVADRPVHVFDIADDYEFMDPELVDRIRAGVEAVLGPD